MLKTRWQQNFVSLMSRILSIIHCTSLHCWELLRPFAHNCQQHPTPAETTTPIVCTGLRRRTTFNVLRRRPFFYSVIYFICLFIFQLETMKSLLILAISSQTSRRLMKAGGWVHAMVTEDSFLRISLKRIKDITGYSPTQFKFYFT